MTTSLDHVAVLVADIERACQVLGASPEGVEAFPSEGTRELYLGAAGAPRLLLMQAIGPGPYQDALSKRGPGLHHVALHTAATRAFASSSGWLVHPRALDRPDRLLWLAHPAVPCLVELVAAPPVPRGALRLSLPGRPSLVSGLGCPDIQPGPQATLAWGGQVFPLDRIAQAG